MTLPIARDLGKVGIRIVAVAPSTFKTPMTDQAQTTGPKGIEDQLAKLTALGRLGLASEFADLCSGIVKSSYLTGTNIRLDGGARHPHL